MDQCIVQLDCFNNGGDVISGKCAYGTCSGDPTRSCGGESGACPRRRQCVPFAGNCHAQALCNENIGFCPTSTPATSTKTCNEGIYNLCTIDSCP